MLFMTPEGRVQTEPPKVHFLDHGFLFGDSIYEVVRIYNGKFFAWEEHLERLFASASRIGMKLPADFEKELSERSSQILRELNEAEAALRMIVTRGVGRLHIDPRTCSTPNLFLAAWKYEAAAHEVPLKLMIPKTRRLSIDSLDPAIKSGNYLNSILGYREAVEAGYDDALFLNSKGEVTELSTSNIGWVQKGIPCTPSVESGILHGITRKIFTETIPHVKQSLFSLKDLEEAEEIFALSTFKEIVPVVELRLPSGELRKFSSFPQTLDLRKKLRLAVESRLQKARSALK